MKKRNFKLRGWIVIIIGAIVAILDIYAAIGLYLIGMEEFKQYGIVPVALAVMGILYVFIGIQMTKYK